MKVRTLAELNKDVGLFMEYAVPGGASVQAAALLESYACDRIALNLLHAFYSFLPDADDDWVEGLWLVDRKQGVFLLLARSGVSGTGFLYLVTHEQAEFLGTEQEGIWEDEVLGFFGYQGRDDFLEKIKEEGRMRSYEPLHLDEKTCPICYVAEGEHHILGCPVEVCPWCDGQLAQCPCRFSLLDTDEISAEAHLEKLQEKLKDAGRIPYAADQKPGYLAVPGSSEKKD